MTSLLWPLQLSFFLTCLFKLIEPELTPKQKELVKIQMEKESAIREKLQKVGWFWELFLLLSVLQHHQLCSVFGRQSRALILLCFGMTALVGRL